MWIELLTVFALWRLTHLFYKEDGPYKMFVRIRVLARKYNIEVFNCFLCLSVWFSIPFAIYTGHFFVSWLGLSGIAILIHKVIVRLASKQPEKTIIETDDEIMEEIKKKGGG